GALSVSARAVSGSGWRASAPPAGSVSGMTVVSGATESGGTAGRGSCARAGAEIKSAAAATRAAARATAPVRRHRVTSASAPPHELHEGAYRNAGRTLWQRHEIALGVRSSGDVEVHPREVTDEFLEEEC